MLQLKFWYYSNNSTMKYPRIFNFLATGFWNLKKLHFVAINFWDDVVKVFFLEIMVLETYVKSLSSLHKGLTIDRTLRRGLNRRLVNIQKYSVMLQSLPFNMNRIQLLCHSDLCTEQLDSRSLDSVEIYISCSVH